jgi:hypothetical protein
VDEGIKIVMGDAASACTAGNAAKIYACLHGAFAHGGRGDGFFSGGALGGGGRRGGWRRGGFWRFSGGGCVFWAQLSRWAHRPALRPV